MGSVGHRPPIGRARGVGYSDPDILRVTHLGILRKAGWVTEVGIRAGRAGSTNAQIEPALFAEDGNDAPTTIIWSGTAKTAASYMADNAGGADLVWKNPNILLTANMKIGGGIRVDGAAARYGMLGDGTRMYRDLAATVMPSTFDIDDSSPQGVLDMWVYTQDNRQPNRPVVVEPLPNASTTDPTPTITIQHSDPDTAHGDYFYAYQIEVWDSANRTRLRTSNRVTTSSSQRASNTASWTPASLPEGSYTIRAYTYDRVNVRSAATQWTITVTSGGSYAISTTGVNPRLGTTAFGRADVINTTRPTITATWSHDSGLTAVNTDIRIQRIPIEDLATPDPNDTASENQTELVIEAIAFLLAGEYRPTDGVAGQTQDGTSITADFDDTSWSPLVAGPYAYRYQIRGEDINGTWSEWASSRPFVVNLAPSISYTSPSSGDAVASLPEFVGTVTDLTDDPGSHQVSIDIRPTGGSAKAIFPLHVGDGVYKGTATTTEMPALGAYEWRMVAGDPWGLWTYGPWQTVNYVAPPSITGLDPADEAVITTGTPVITATVDRQLVQYRITIRKKGSQRIYYDSRVTNTSGTTISRQVTAGKLVNDTEYDLVLWIHTSDGLEYTQVTQFRLAYVSLAQMDNVTYESVPASPYDVGDGNIRSQNPNVMIGWGMVPVATVSDEEWLGYLITRENDGRVWRILDRYQTSMLDVTPKSGVDHVYTVQYERTINIIDTIRSTPVVGTVGVTLYYATLTSLTGEDPGLTMHFWDRRVLQLVTDVTPVEVLGQRAPDAYQSPTAYQRFEIEAKVLDPEHGLWSTRDVVETARLLAQPAVREASVVDIIIAIIEGILSGRDVPIPTDLYRPHVMYYRDPTGAAFPVVIQTFEEVHQHEPGQAAFRMTGFEVFVRDQV